MAAKKESSLIQYEIEFLEEKLVQLRNYIDARPFDKLEDRFRLQKTKTGGVMEVLTKSIEDQRKDITSAIKEYAEITIIVEKMREKEESKAEAKGKSIIPARMQV